MLHITTRRTRGNIALLCLTGITLLLASGCGSSAPAESASPGAAQAAPLAGVLAQLPSPDELSRQAEMIPNPLMCPGSEYQHSLPHPNVADNGADAVYSPQWGGTFALPQAAFAVYQFRESDLEFLAREPAQVLITGVVPGPPAGMRVFAGLGWGGAWHWAELQVADPTAVESWAWAIQPQWGGFRSTDNGLLLPAVLVAFGSGQFSVRTFEIVPANTLAAGPVVFRKGWDGTIKGRTAFDGSVNVVGDDAGGVHVSYYDSSCGQLDYMQLHGRNLFAEAVTCGGDSGLFNSLVLDPSGSPALAWYDPQGQNGEIGDITDGTDGMSWSGPITFDNGDTGSGGPPDDVGRHCSLIYDDQGVPHIFYEDVTIIAIKHAYLPAGAVVWTTEQVSQPGDDASMPVAMRKAGGTCCAFVVNSHTGPFDLVLAQPGGATGWMQDVIARDVANPLGASSTLAGFCDGSVRPGTDEAVIAYSFTGGVRVIHRDIAARTTVSSDVANGTPGAGAFVKLAMMADGSVFVMDYEAEHGIIVVCRNSVADPGTFSKLPAIQLPAGTTCDDLDFWVSPDDLDGDGYLDMATVTLTSFDTLSALKSKELTGHVTLIK